MSEERGQPSMAVNSSQRATSQRFGLPMGMAKADAIRIGLVVFLQLGNMFIMGITWCDWKGWAQESQSSKRWMIGGSFQTIITIIALTSVYRDWLKRKKER
ncbi:hypothetical protein FLONG3_6298 [Fusarium longipes]|uniref:Uncharacterized protein n=1 Tax=Fusarium longipes TaxID=694270 RepID=A0A395SMA5_9HYPO|nr:hypothetical protein FLONG3_6298 [Fusarium longipes]